VEVYGFPVSRVRAEWSFAVRFESDGQGTSGTPDFGKGLRRKCVEHTCCNGHDENRDIISAGEKGVDDLDRRLYEVG